MPDAQLSSPCCVEALRDKWEDGKIVVCGVCFRPYTAFVDVQVTGSVRAEVPSWWTGLR